VTSRGGESQSVTEFRRKTFRILLAEDNITNQQVAAAFLKKLGLRADTVANGVEALHALATLPYDLVLMDVQMPEMDGLEATRIVRSYELAVSSGPATKEGAAALPFHPSSFTLHPSSRSPLPIIAMTARALKGDREMCLAAGMDGYVPKPVTLPALAQVLEQWLPTERGPSCPPPTTHEATPSGPAGPPVERGHSCPPPTTNEAPPSGQNVRAPAEADSSRSGQECPRPADNLELPVFDLVDLRLRLMDDDDLGRLLAEGFLEDIPKRIVALKTALAAGATANAEREAHTIKGASAAVSGQALRAAAAGMEQSAREGDLAAVTARLPGLDAQFARLQTELNTYIKSQ
jgi:CheY-like chemotaxis protein/HPt (histidine-containing phosphotransfer) domain-containing protein